MKREHGQSEEGEKIGSPTLCYGATVCSPAAEGDGEGTSGGGGGGAREGDMDDDGPLAF